MGFGPVTVTGSFAQGSATQQIKGAELKPHGDNRFGRNQATAWWEDDCTDPTFCPNNRGSNAWQGSVVEALYEFPNHQAVSPDDFDYTAYWRHHCGTGTGICR